jgi:hypothetical protein
LSTTVIQEGRISKTISVVTDSPEFRNIQLRFTADIYRPISAKPSFRFFLNTVEGEEVSQRILLHRADGKSLIVRRTAVDRPEIAVTTEVATGKNDAEKAPKQTESPWGSRADIPPPTAAAGDVWLELAAAGSTPPGNYRGIVKVATDHPDVPELHIPYTLRVRPYIEAKPDTVRFWTAPTPSSGGRSTILTLSHLGGREFTVTGVEVSHPELFSAAANSAEASVRQLVRTALAADLDREKLGTTVQGWIRIQTDDPGKPVVEVPVIIATKKVLSRRPVSQMTPIPPSTP